MGSRFGLFVGGHGIIYVYIKSHLHEYTQGAGRIRYCGWSGILPHILVDKSSTG
jgi:hypothetical protein